MGRREGVGLACDGPRQGWCTVLLLPPLCLLLQGHRRVGGLEMEGEWVAEMQWGEVEGCDLVWRVEW